MCRPRTAEPVPGCPRGLECCCCAVPTDRPRGPSPVHSADPPTAPSCRLHNPVRIFSLGFLVTLFVNVYLENVIYLYVNIYQASKQEARSKQPPANANHFYRISHLQRLARGHGCVRGGARSYPNRCRDHVGVGVIEREWGAVQ